MAAVDAPPTMAELDSLLCGSSFSSSTPTDVSMANSASTSLSSTPPTTVSPDSMSLASELDLPKPETIIAASIEAAAVAVAALPEDQDHKLQQRESGQQSPVSADADAIVVAEPLPIPEPPSTSRPRRARSSLPVYNIAKLAGTDVHGRRRSKGDSVLQARRRTIPDGTLAQDDGLNPDVSIDTLADASQLAQRETNASSTKRAPAILHTSKTGRIFKKSLASTAAANLTRRATRLSGVPAKNITTKLSALGKKGKKALENGIKGLTRELRRLQDTNEFAGIDTRPVRYTVWSNGKYTEVDPTQPTSAPEPPRKKVKVDEKAAVVEEKPVTEKQESGAAPAKRPRGKKWLEKGLYAGQEAPLDIFKGLTPQEKKKLASLPELMPTGKANRTLPQPMYNGLRILLTGRDFKLPFDVCNPLPPGQPKPAAYRTMTKNRFVGDAASYWKKTPHFEDFASKCVCTPADGCGEDCQNRIMLYECDETNCSLGKAYCTNRAFQDLQARTKKGGRYRVGVEVLKTGDRGYGVRSNRCFEPNQIIMEYTGEIITDEECERRMNEVYRDNECYYLMSFDQNMIIDATTGSIARFVNHSCSPNCRMIKWIVSGQPRMALFAGDRPITTGEELTYDYNFDPFSAKNVQKCLCGSPNCRGVLGPKPKEVKPPKPPKEDKKKKKRRMAKAASKLSVTALAKGAAKKTAAKKTAAGKPSAQTSAKASTKRKLKDAFEFDGDDEAEAKAAKKRKIKAATGLKRTLSSASLKVAKGAAKGVTTIKRSAASISVAAKKKTKVTSKVAKVKATFKKAVRKGGVVKKSTTAAKKTTAATTATTTTKKTTSASSSTTTTTTTTKKFTQTKLVLPSRSPSLTIVAAGVATTPSAAAKKATASTSTPLSSAKRTPKLTLSSSGGGGKTSAGRKVTPSRKAVEAGLAVGLGGSPASARSGGLVVKPVTKIRLVSGGGGEK